MSIKSFFDLRKYIFANLLSLLAYFILFFTIFIFLIYPFLLTPFFDLFFTKRIQLETIAVIYIYFYLFALLFLFLLPIEFLIYAIKKKHFLRAIEHQKIKLIYNIIFYIGIFGIICFFWLAFPLIYYPLID